MLTNYHDPLPGVPKVESPFFDQLFDDSDPRFQAARDLRENGFAVIDFPDDEFDAVAERIKRDLHGRANWPHWHETGGEMRIIEAWQFNEDIRRIATNQKVLDLLAFLYGRPAFPFQTLTFPVGTQQHFHTDSVHFSSMPERFMCGVWTAFEDIGPDQGPLLYYPGSHRWPIYRHEHIGYTYRAGDPPVQSSFHDMWERLVEVHGVEPERFYPRKGQALIWAANLLHGGDRHNDRSQTRWSHVTHYFFDDCVYYTPLASNEPAGEHLVRAPRNILTGDFVPSRYHGRTDLALSGVRDVPGRPGAPQFDPERYLGLHPDVAAGGWDAWRHYILHGLGEGRRWY